MMNCKCRRWSKSGGRIPRAPGGGVGGGGGGGVRRLYDVRVHLKSGLCVGVAPVCDSCGGERNGHVLS